MAITQMNQLCPTDVHAVIPIIAMVSEFLLRYVITEQASKKRVKLLPARFAVRCQRNRTKNFRGNSLYFQIAVKTQRKLAAGMERDHFRDMIRLALIDSLYKFWPQFESYVQETAALIPSALEKIRSINPHFHNVVF